VLFKDENCLLCITYLRLSKKNKIGNSFSREQKGYFPPS
jgi:hypothetical protein